MVIGIPHICRECKKKKRCDHWLGSKGKGSYGLEFCILGFLGFWILDLKVDFTAVASISQPIMNIATARMTNPTCELKNQN